MKQPLLLASSALAIAAAFGQIGNTGGRVEPADNKPGVQSESTSEAAETTSSSSSSLFTSGTGFAMRVGGYFESLVGYAASDYDGIIVDHSPELSGIDVKRDAEIHFQPSLALDNGVQIGANVQLEAATAGDQIDEAYIFADGFFGRVLLGSENSARYLMQYAAPDVTFFGVNSGDVTSFIPFSGAVGTFNDNDNVPDTAGAIHGHNIFRATLGSTYIENMANDDAERITYFTPRMYGFQFGTSYARDADQDSNAQQDISDETLVNIADFGANYVRSFRGVDMAISGGYGLAFGDAEDNPQVWNAGLNLGWRNWTLGGSFAEQNNAGNMDGTAYDAGLAYNVGPWGFSFTYFQGENVDNEYNSVDTTDTTPGDGEHIGQGGVDETQTMFLLGMNYDLVQGVRLSTFGGYASFEEETGDDGGTGDNVDGFVVGSGVRIDF